MLDMEFLLKIPMDNINQQDTQPSLQMLTQLHMYTLQGKLYIEKHQISPCCQSKFQLDNQWEWQNLLGSTVLVDKELILFKLRLIQELSRLFLLDRVFEH